MSLREKFNTTQLYTKKLPLEELYFHANFDNCIASVNGAVIPTPVDSKFPLPVPYNDTLILQSQLVTLPTPQAIISESVLNTVQREIGMYFLVAAPNAADLTASDFITGVQIDVREVGSITPATPDGVFYTLGSDATFSVCTGNAGLLNSENSRVIYFDSLNNYGVGGGQNDAFFMKNANNTNKVYTYFDAYRVKIRIESDQVAGNPAGITIQARGGNFTTVVFNSLRRLK